jgi:hypothetical protein
VLQFYEVKRPFDINKISSRKNHLPTFFDTRIALKTTRQTLRQLLCVSSKQDTVGLLTISAVYLSPKHTVKQEQLDDF